MNEKTLANKFIVGDEKLGFVCDSFGAKILAFYVNGRNVLFYDENDISHSGIPLCFPSFGPLDNSEFIWQGKSYPMKQHGFIRDNDFELLAKTGLNLSLILRSSQLTKDRYPFDFEFTVIYSLLENELVMTYEFKNLSKSTLPLAPGIHPYFAVDKPQEITFSSDAVELNDNLQGYELISLKDSKCLEQLKKQIYKVHGAPDMHILGHSISRNILNCGSSKIEMTFDTFDFQRFTVWRKDDTAPYICFEPANEKNALNSNPITVEAGESWRTVVRLKAI